ncbi:hypothetical protein ACWIUD_01105 [Helicobacter sp. 23-1044]
MGQKWQKLHRFCESQNLHIKSQNLAEFSWQILRITQKSQNLLNFSLRNLFVIPINKFIGF